MGIGVWSNKMCRLQAFQCGVAYRTHTHTPTNTSTSSKRPFIFSNVKNVKQLQRWLLFPTVCCCCWQMVVKENWIASGWWLEIFSLPRGAFGGIRPRQAERYRASQVESSRSRSNNYMLNTRVINSHGKGKDCKKLIILMTGLIKFKPFARSREGGN